MANTKQDVPFPGLGDRLRESRELGGLAARELDRLAGISEAYATMIESGERNNIAAYVAAAYARVLGISVDWLLSGKGQGPTPRKTKEAVAHAREQHRRAKTGS